MSDEDKATYSIRVASVCCTSKPQKQLESNEKSPVYTTKQTSNFLRKVVMFDPDCPLCDIQYADSLFPYFALGSIGLFFTLLAVAYWMCIHSYACDAVDERQEALERTVPRTAFWILFVTFVAQAVPIVFTPNRKPSGILLAGMSILFVSTTANAMLAWGPSMVVIDNITTSRVFLIRWCEWTPMAGLMTLLAESVDLPKKTNPWEGAVIFASSQALSTFCGFVLPFCTTWYTWSFWMTLSFMTFFPIFPRVMVRREAFLQTPRGRTVLEREHYDRRRVSYQLMLTCAIVWSG